MLITSEDVIFYDFEVVRKGWLVTFESFETFEKFTIVNDKNLLRKFLEANIDNNIFVGFNVKHYDKWVLFGILNGLNAWHVTQEIIQNKKQGWQVVGRSKYDFKMINVDLMDELVAKPSLKEIEANLGMAIEESKIDFDTDEELVGWVLETFTLYNYADINALRRLFNERIDWFRAKSALVTHFNLPLKDMSLSFGRMLSNLLGAKRKSYSHYYKFELPENINVGKYNEALFFFDSQEYDVNVSRHLTLKVGDVDTNLGIGGGHSARKQVVYFAKKGTVLRNSDVEGYYPKIGIEYDALSRSIESIEPFINIGELRKVTPKTDPLNLGLKLQRNTGVGLSKDKTSDMYDPVQNYRVCAIGQLALIDLIDKLENKCKSFHLIQNNTDGILYRVSEKESDLALEISNEWEQRNRFRLEHDNVEYVWQKDVNNYVMAIKKKDGTLDIKTKGAFVSNWKGGDFLKNTSTVIDLAVVKFLTEQVPIEKTIRDVNNDLIRYQYVIKAGPGYSYVTAEKPNETKKLQKVNRGFAVENGYRCYKHKNTSKGISKQKIASLPLVEINNGIIDGSLKDNKEWQYKLDYSWYIKETWRRIYMFVSKDNFTKLVKMNRKLNQQ